MSIRKEKIVNKQRFLVCLLVSVLMLTVNVVSVSALERPTKEQWEKYKLDGTLAQRIEAAKAIGNHRVAPQLVERLKYRLNRQKLEAQGKSAEEIDNILAPPPAWQGMPTSGDIKVLVLLVDFQDTPAIDTSQYMWDRILGNGPAEAIPTDSLRNYYLRSSYGKLNLGGSVLGWYTTPYPRNQVVQTTEGRHQLLMEILTHYDQQGHDFSQYDNNNDGEIDYFAVIWTGTRGEWGSFWWGYQTYFNNPNFKLDGKRLGAYSWQAASSSYPSGTFSPSTLIHETGHALGLPDLYDYDGDIGPDGGVGNLDMMDGGSYDHCSFHKFLLEWIQPTVITAGSRNLTLNSLAGSGQALLLMADAVDGNPFGEFFMIANRYREQNDVRLPADGLLIWHVDSRLDEYGYNFRYDNSYSDHKYVRLMEADGLEQIERNLSADAGDFYVQGSRFAFFTSPNSNKYNGEHSGVFVKNISAPGKQMTLTCGVNTQVGMHLEIDRNDIRGWLIRRQYARFIMEIDNPRNLDIAKILIFRKDPGKEFVQVKDVNLSEVYNRHWQGNDEYIDKDVTYVYKAVAYDASGEILGTSDEITL